MLIAFVLFHWNLSFFCATASWRTPKTGVGAEASVGGRLCSGALLNPGAPPVHTGALGSAAASILLGLPAGLLSAGSSLPSSWSMQLKDFGDRHWGTQAPLCPPRWPSAPTEQPRPQNPAVTAETRGKEAVGVQNPAVKHHWQCTAQCNAGHVGGRRPSQAPPGRQRRMRHQPCCHPSPSVRSQGNPHVAKGSGLQCTRFPQKSPNTRSGGTWGSLCPSPTWPLSTRMRQAGWTDGLSNFSLLHLI